MAEPTLRHLRAFVAVVDEGTFTDAAITLGVSQATVSRNVAALEAGLDVRLLHRTARDVTLTSEGHQVLVHARAVLSQVGALLRTADEVAGELRVGFVWGALGRHTGALQRRWSDATGGSELLFVQSQDRSAGLDGGRVRAAIVRWPLDERRFDAALVGVERRYAAVAVDDPLAGRGELSVTDLDGRTVAIDRETGSTTPELWSGTASPVAVRTVRGVEAWLTMIGSGRAVGVTPAATVDRHGSTDVVFVPLVDAPPIQVWVARHRDVEDAGVDTLVRLARALYGAGQDHG